ncbi:hypothetical protein A3Q56_05917 [Intoshia linei]|uniref:Uncharacterized protein n=1 Tax=Intoshia linei TaxID=1819745 RepID=A0A177AWM4_9BILA|nr:hypothetical protein A3Q56_05917 [Intoshia linei]
MCQSMDQYSFNNRERLPKKDKRNDNESVDVQNNRETTQRLQQQMILAEISRLIDAEFSDYIEYQTASFEAAIREHDENVNNL